MSLCTDRCPNCGKKIHLHWSAVGHYGYCPCGWREPREYAAFTAELARIRAARQGATA